MPLALANGKKMDAVDAYAEVVNAEAALRVQADDDETTAWGAEGNSTGAKAYKDKDPRESIIDIREYDVPYYLRVAIDNGKSFHINCLPRFTDVVQTRHSCGTVVCGNFRCWTTHLYTNA